MNVYWKIFYPNFSQNRTKLYRNMNLLFAKGKGLLEEEPKAS